MQRSAAARGPRYVAKFQNGTWQVFDQIYYGVVGAEQTEKVANQRAGNLNARKGVPQRKVMR